jgi:CheY-like chemotaxis protein
MDGLTATRAICGLMTLGMRPFAPVVVRMLRVCTRAAPAQRTSHSFITHPSRLLGVARAHMQALTASCSEEERARCAQAGCVELLPKPIKLSSLEVRRC